MRRGERSQHRELEEALQAQGEAPGPAAGQAPAAEEEEAGTASLSAAPALIPGTADEVLAAGSPSPQEASSLLSTIAFILCSQSDESSCSEEEGPDPAGPGSLLQETLGEKIAHLVYFLLHKYRNKEPLTKAEMLSAVIKSEEEHFPAIFEEASECMRLVFGIEVKEADPTGHSYVLAPSLGLSYDGMLGDDQSKPKTGLLITVLGTIFMAGDCASEEIMWESLSVLGVWPGREHCMYGEPRKLLTQDWVQEAYLEYRRVPGSDPARYEFLWGPRAHAETSKMKVLEHVAKVSGRDAASYPSLYEEALRAEREREAEQEF
ncbi:melanoma-associated antigen 8-like [Carlito syrichta]|uniref:Melanoma-associated antigen 8-like n=1 Tax=Carlito syrichta TaxID=1868482 RepID=A0A1U7TDK4_CARSF|nr:melanoma-associated antigen 8-like [Carlito syrichta]